MSGREKRNSAYQGSRTVARKLAVIGAGLMGSGIAQVSAQAGWDVVLRDVTDEALRRGTDGIRASYDKFVAKGKL
ncbi:3-hydroxyacyl-CoA dehydrogenase NAD-binding domain-containing protein, partial [Streptomyces sp. NPDC056296]|uniref:3-hydroxyacyl-CoA dehydrogenase NAD-binding domain-containing protein n=1 Tax=Streptomyces sp. NPDC056296 TaxID=3345775 RepID=UPI0035E19413